MLRIELRIGFGKNFKSKRVVDEMELDIVCGKEEWL